MCEKPMAVSSAEAEAMIAACNTAGKKLMIGYRSQFEQYNRHAIDLVKQRKGSAHAPKHVKFVTELPMTGVGKVDKKVLKAGFWTGRDRMVG